MLQFEYPRPVKSPTSSIRHNFRRSAVELHKSFSEMEVLLPIYCAMVLLGYHITKLFHTYGHKYHLRLSQICLNRHTDLCVYASLYVYSSRFVKAWGLWKHTCCFSFRCTLLPTFISRNSHPELFYKTGWGVFRFQKIVHITTINLVKIIAK